jgi:hypothetical protein
MSVDIKEQVGSVSSSAPATTTTTTTTTTTEKQIVIAPPWMTITAPTASITYTFDNVYQNRKIFCILRYDPPSFLLPPATMYHPKLPKHLDADAPPRFAALGNVYRDSTYHATANSVLNIHDAWCVHKTLEKEVEGWDLAEIQFLRSLMKRIPPSPVSLEWDQVFQTNVTSLEDAIQRYDSLWIPQVGIDNPQLYGTLIQVVREILRRNTLFETDPTDAMALSSKRFPIAQLVYPHHHSFRKQQEEDGLEYDTPAHFPGCLVHKAQWALHMEYCATLSKIGQLEPCCPPGKAQNAATGSDSIHSGKGLSVATDSCEQNQTRHQHDWWFRFDPDLPLARRILENIQLCINNAPYPNRTARCVQANATPSQYDTCNDRVGNHSNPQSAVVVVANTLSTITPAASAAATATCSATQTTTMRSLNK